jgi:hypothetical protein
MSALARRSLLCAIALLAAWPRAASAEQSHLVIVVGLGGEPKYAVAVSR